MYLHTIPWVIAVILTGCGTSQPQPQSPPNPEPPSGVSGRKTLTEEQCQAQRGTIIADIGDGATRRADYVCPTGRPPLGNIAPPAGGPIPVEGTVCCPP